MRPSVSREDFERFVEEGIEEIPEEFRAKLKNVAFLVEDEPSADVRMQEDLSDNETLLGYYHGIPNTARGGDYGVGMTLPDTITVYQLPTEEMALRQAQGKPKDVEKIVREIVIDTVYHEVAHYLGFDEEGVEERERLRLQRRKKQNGL